MTKIHDLKCYPVYFKKLAEGVKTFEYRKDDRNYKKGDYLHLVEFNSASKEYSGYSLWFEVLDVFRDDRFLKDGYVILSIKPYFNPRTPNILALE